MFFTDFPATLLVMLGHFGTAAKKIRKHTLVVLSTLLIALPDKQADGAQKFSDDNLSNIGNISPGRGQVDAVATDAFGNLYVGGVFTTAGGVFATNIAKWNGSTWSAIGSGINGEVGALLVVGNEL